VIDIERMDGRIVATTNEETRRLPWFCSVRPFQYIRESSLCHGVTDVVRFLRTVDCGLGYVSVERLAKGVCRLSEGTNVFVEGTT
jgi:hypothetical protein